MDRWCAFLLDLRFHLLFPMKVGSHKWIWPLPGSLSLSVLGTFLFVKLWLFYLDYILKISVYTNRSFVEMMYRFNFGTFNLSVDIWKELERGKSIKRSIRLTFSLIFVHLKQLETNKNNERLQRNSNSNRLIWRRIGSTLNGCFKSNNQWGYIFHNR